MPARRVQKVAEAIREVVSLAILTDLNDPRIDHVTVTYVEVTADLRQARVHVSVMGSDSQQQRCVQALQHAAGYLQSKIGKRIETRYTPRLKFQLDMGVKQALKISQILESVLPDSADDDDDEEIDNAPTSSNDLL